MPGGIRRARTFRGSNSCAWSLSARHWRVWARPPRPGPARPPARAAWPRPPSLPARHRRPPRPTAGPAAAAWAAAARTRANSRRPADVCQALHLPNRYCFPVAAQQCNHCAKKEGYEQTCALAFASTACGMSVQLPSAAKRQPCNAIYDKVSHYSVAAQHMWHVGTAIVPFLCQ